MLSITKFNQNQSNKIDVEQIVELSLKYILQQIFDKNVEFIYFKIQIDEKYRIQIQIYENLQCVISFLQTFFCSFKNKPRQYKTICQYNSNYNIKQNQKRRDTHLQSKKKIDCNQFSIQKQDKQDSTQKEKGKKKMVNCQKCRKSEPLNLICLDPKCGPQQNLNLICCTCHNAALIHHTISINMFLDIAFIATQSWIDSKEQTNSLIAEVENLIQKLQERKAKMVQFLSYYEKSKHKYNKLQNLIQEFRYQINDQSYDEYEEFEETFLEIKNHFSFVPSNPRLPIKLNSEQSLDVIQSNLQEELDEFSRSYLQLLEIRDEDLKQLLQQQIQSQHTNSYNQNGNHNNVAKNSTFSNNLKVNNHLNGNLQGQKITYSASSGSNQQNSKKSSTNFITLQQQIQNLYEPKEMLDYDELYSKNCIDIGFKVVPKYVEDRKNIEKSSNESIKKNGVEEPNKIYQNQSNNSTSISQNQVTDSKTQTKMEIEQTTNSTLQSENHNHDIQVKSQKLNNQNTMEIEKKDELNLEQKQQYLNQENNHSENKNEKDSSYQQQFDKQVLSLEDQRDKKDLIQYFDSVHQKTVSNSNLSLAQQQQQQQINKLEKKILTRSASATNTNNQGTTSVAQFTSQPTSLTSIPQANNASPEKDKDKDKEKEKEKERQREKEKERENVKQQLKVEKDIEQINYINKKADSYSNISQSSKQNIDSKQQFSQRRYQNNEEDQDMSSNRKYRGESSEDEDDDNNDAQKSQSFPSGKKPKYIKKYDRKGQDYLKTLTEEQIDELIQDYNHLKNWREVEKKWGISKYHIIKFFKEKNYILTSQDENDFDTESR
ncbi:hypothetical protein TTHERM_00058730 (macronuclear) [Tetrahymena thermophila SB210]|uniref:Uncharacterized protein n=1 Tax=Tetrahymena thermophila (strain SB210) TaxID=312017 RepID=I7M6W0_TETTS|nr:hypothetical protein TTHERM_00058730 [Tetrahymena thermophila SB210]EAR87361.2 hypothetical protein TTHERM_00058730 [Tetrahymena thermophila SB210]|eukprot:XP_001007606.2 hypothetical protein TTHERM_00058730 [Tetrahymena thermophila SB210]